MTPEMGKNNSIVKLMKEVRLNDIASVENLERQQLDGSPSSGNY